MEPISFIIVALAILGVGMVSCQLRQSIITAPMLFVLFGLLVGPIGLAYVHWDFKHPIVESVVEFTLMLVLFTEAASISLKGFWKNQWLVVRLLVFGLPLAVLIGLLFGKILFPQLDVWHVALIAAILAPTDMALGHAVLGVKGMPKNMRRSLQVEGGFNDGIMLPVVILLLVCESLARPGEFVNYWHFWVVFASKQLLLGTLVGATIGWLGSRLIGFILRTTYMTNLFEQLSVLALAVLAFGGAEIVGANGFVAAFAAGLTFGNVKHSVPKRCLLFSDEQGQLLSLITFLIFGSVIVGEAMMDLSWEVVLYAVLSLTVVRIGAVAISTLGLGLRWESVLLLGWFGPRGIASILFGLIVLESPQILEREFIFQVMAVTVFLSIFAHGLSAIPFGRWYVQRILHRPHPRSEAQ